VIVDSSAIIAIVRAEPDAAVYAEAMAEAAELSVSAATYLESAIVADAGRDPVSMRTFDVILERNRIAIEPVTAEQAVIAREAYRDFGKGSGHPARLNFGDCFSYALASVTGQPLLFKGDDFVHTDIRPAVTD
jgi:ribonuclease VapC